MEQELEGMRVKREFVVFVFKVGEIMACLCANGNDPGKRENRSRIWERQSLERDP